MPTYAEQAAAALERLRSAHPLIHQITNFVVMNDSANMTLHFGGLPVMAHGIDEVEEMVAHAGALVLNLGTLTPDWVDAMERAGRRANELGVPVVLDPVGAGATSLRTSMARRLLDELHVTVLRGNAGEIAALVGAGGEVRGVESVGALADPQAVATRAAQAFRTTVAMTGRRDLICDGRRALAVENGHSWLPTLTGTGCMASAVAGCFAAVEPDALVAAAAALASYGLAAELAAEGARGPASFKLAFFDQAYHLTPAQVLEGARITQLA
ncbi:hydroxyethylthiazole kinase [Chloroflexia bacterium SDU3-3]|nr:hydroxyethylthiazole kinase [Chloroflexia bacterium SDU3-3]